MKPILVIAISWVVGLDTADGGRNGPKPVSLFGGMQEEMGDWPSTARFAARPTELVTFASNLAPSPALGDNRRSHVSSRTAKPASFWL
jgi:hypothetical protein